MNVLKIFSETNIDKEELKALLRGKRINYYSVKDALYLMSYRTNEIGLKRLLAAINEIEIYLLQELYPPEEEEGIE